MRKRIVWSTLVLGVVGTGIAATALAGSGRFSRPDCPGTVVCPLTGETVCRDRCPLNAEEPKTEARPSCCAASRTPKW